MTSPDFSEWPIDCRLFSVGAIVDNAIFQEWCYGSLLLQLMAILGLRDSSQKIPTLSNFISHVWSMFIETRCFRDQISFGGTMQRWHGNSNCDNESNPRGQNFHALNFLGNVHILFDFRPISGRGSIVQHGAFWVKCDRPSQQTPHPPFSKCEPESGYNNDRLA
jgi:hypothetical protein